MRYKVNVFFDMLVEKSRKSALLPKKKFIFVPN